MFVATKDGVEFGGVLFDEKNDRVLLLATSILPEYRGMGLAAALTRRVLDSLHAEGKRVTVRCPTSSARSCSNTRSTQPGLAHRCRQDGDADVSA